VTFISQICCSVISRFSICTFGCSFFLSLRCILFSSVACRLLLPPQKAPSTLRLLLQGPNLRNCVQIFLIGKLSITLVEPCGLLKDIFAECSEMQTLVLTRITLIAIWPCVNYNIG